MNTIAVQVRERPILFSGEMVNAILEGRKSQTRRVITRDNSTVDGSVWPRDRFAALDFSAEIAADKSYKSCACLKYLPCSMDDDPSCGHRVRSRMEVGDHLWVRETFARCACDICRKIWPAETPHGILGYRASYPGPSVMVFKPSIFMPRWASRLTLEVTKMRVERVQDISEADAEAEGLRRSERTGLYPSPAGNCAFANWAFRYRWGALNEKRGFGWEKNPWVWVIDFRKISSAGEEKFLGRDPSLSTSERKS